MTESQGAMAAARARQWYEKETRERMLAGKAPDPSANLREGSTGKSGDQAGKAFWRVGERSRSGDALDITLRSERRLGEWLDGVLEHGGNWTSKSRLPHETLKDLGVTQIQWQRWQKFTDLPDEDFEAHMAGERKRGQKVTTSGVLAQFSTVSGTACSCQSGKTHTSRVR